MKGKHHTVETVPKFNRKKFVEKDKIDIPSTSNLVCTIRAGFTIVLRCALVQDHVGQETDLPAKKSSTVDFLLMWCNFKFEGALFQRDSKHNDRVIFQ